MKQWQKGLDFTDDSARYTFEGRDPSYTLETIRVVIYTEREKEYSHDTKKRIYYYGYVTNNEKECSDTVGRFKTLKQAKEETLKLFNEYCVLFPEAV